MSDDSSDDDKPLRRKTLNNANDTVSSISSSDEEEDDSTIKEVQHDNTKQVHSSEVQKKEVHIDGKTSPLESNPVSQGELTDTTTSIIKKRKRYSSDESQSEEKDNADKENTCNSSSEDDTKSQNLASKSSKKRKLISNGEKKKSHGSGTNESSKLKNLKRYLLACGVRINNYQKLFDGIHSMKGKETKLSSMLEDIGMKGRPNLSMCKKIKAKRDEAAEVASLDKNNIIESSTRQRRSCTVDNQSHVYDSLTHIEQSSGVNKEQVSLFKNISDLFDSDSDEEGNLENDGQMEIYVTCDTKPSKQRKIIDDDDDE